MRISNIGSSGSGSGIPMECPPCRCRCSRICLGLSLSIVAIFTIDEIHHRSIIHPSTKLDLEVAKLPMLYMCDDRLNPESNANTVANAESNFRDLPFHERACAVTPTIASLFPDYSTIQDVMTLTGRTELAKDFGGSFGKGFAMCSPPDYLNFDVAAVRQFPPLQLALARTHDLAVVVGNLSPYCNEQLTRFPGKILFMNTEAYDEHPYDYGRQDGSLAFNSLPSNPNMYVIGPHEDVPGKAIQVPAVSFIYHTFFASRYDLRKLNKRRPRNTRKHFLIYANHHYVYQRERAFWELANEFANEELHYVGPCQGNHEARPGSYRAGDGSQLSLFTGDCTPWESDGNRPVNIVESPYAEKLAGETDRSQLSFVTNQLNGFENYRFVLCMESYVRGGYVTEKILVAFLSGAIPIYYGSQTVFDIFNRDAFVFVDVKNPVEAMGKIRQLEENPKEYRKMRNQPMLADGERTIEKYFSYDGHLRERIRSMMGLSGVV